MECPETEFILLSVGSNDRGSDATPMGYCAFVGSWNKSWGYRDTMIANFVLYIQICRQTHFPRLRQQNGVYVPDRMQRGQHPAFPGPFRWPPDGRETGAKEVKPDSWVSPLWGGFCGRLTARETRPKHGPQNRARLRPGEPGGYQAWPGGHRWATTGGWQVLRCLQRGPGHGRLALRTWPVACTLNGPLAARGYQTGAAPAGAG